MCGLQRLERNGRIQGKDGRIAEAGKGLKSTSGKAHDCNTGERRGRLKLGEHVLK